MKYLIFVALFFCGCDFQTQHAYVENGCAISRNCIFELCAVRKICPEPQQ